MRVMIYGAGAMGTVLGAYIAKSGRQADLVTRNAEHVAALNGSGAHITGTVNFTVPVHALLNSEVDGVYDIIFLMTKQGDNAALLSLLPHIAPNGIVCTLQNGLPEPVVASLVGEEHCCGCAVSWGATFIGGGQVQLTTNPDALQFALGDPYGEIDPAVFDEIKSLLGCMGKVTVEDNFIGARWIKLAINSAFSSLSAMSGLTFGQVAEGRLSRAAALGIFNECIAAGKACGIKAAKIQGHNVAKLLGYKSKIKKSVALRLVPVVMKNHSALQSGMLFDLKKGKKCEINYINGVVISYGARVRFSTPLNTLAVKIIHEIECGSRTISPDNIQLFKDLV